MRSLHCILSSLNQDLILEKDLSPGAQGDWVFVACRATFEKCPHQECNHFMPAWPAKHFGLDVSEKEAFLLGRQLTEEKEEIKQRFHDVADDLDCIDAMEAAAAEEHDFIGRKAVFLDQLLQSNLLPGFVPADGNCGLWSVASLLLNKLPSQMNSGDSKKLMVKQRKVLAQAWAKVSTNPMWQKLFLDFDLACEIPAKLKTPAKAPEIPTEAEAPPDPIPATVETPAKAPEIPTEAEAPPDPMPAKRKKAAGTPEIPPEKLKTPAKPAAFGQPKAKSDHLILLGPGSVGVQKQQREVSMQDVLNEDDDDEDIMLADLTKTSQPDEDIMP